MKGEFTAITDRAPQGGYWAIRPEVPGTNGEAPRDADRSDVAHECPVIQEDHEPKRHGCRKLRRARRVVGGDGLQGGAGEYGEAKLQRGHINYYEQNRLLAACCPAAGPAVRAWCQAL